MKLDRRPRYQSTHLWTLDFWQAKNTKWKKESIFNKWCWHNWISTCRRMKIDPYISPCTKLKSKWIKSFYIKPTTLNLTDEKVESILEYIDTGDHFLNITPAAQTLRETINKQDLLKSFLKQRTWPTRQNGSLLNGEISSPTPHQTEIWSPKYTKNSRNLS